MSPAHSPIAAPNASATVRPIVDCHTHTRFSDGEPTFEENIRAAAAAGCRIMVSTDHLTLPASMDPAGEVQVTLTDLPAHRAASRRGSPPTLRLSTVLNATGIPAARKT